MARSSKAQHSFAIYEDGGPATPDGDARAPGHEHVADKRSTAQDLEIDTVPNTMDLNEDLQDEIDSILEQHTRQMQQDEDDRRASGLTTASYSTLPDSDYSTDIDDYVHQRTHSTPVVVRPPFMRTESVRRMQMSSPPPFGSRSPRKSISRANRSRTGTPRSARSVVHHGSPRYQRVSSTEDQALAKEFPLVLLHVTLLAVDLPWSIESMEEVLPHSTLENLRRLHTKIGEIVLQRGVLIPHPRHEYDLLEERLLEALELRSERITKCGHFRSRESGSSVDSMFSMSHDSDSAVGSSIEGSIEDLCADCNCEIKLNRHGVDRRWRVEVFAANGLLRAPAWAAAWSEMERVDVRITPWISELDRRRLDAIKAEEDALREDSSMQIAIPPHSDAHGDREEALIDSDGLPCAPRTELDHTAVIDKTDAVSDLPKVYSRPSDIPISLLLRNYFLLLAQDRRNLVILFLTSGLLFALMQPSMRASTDAVLPRMDDFVPLEVTGVINDLTEHRIMEASGENEMSNNLSLPASLDDLMPESFEPIMSLPDVHYGPDDEKTHEDGGATDDSDGPLSMDDSNGPLLADDTSSDSVEVAIVADDTSSDSVEGAIVADELTIDQTH